MTINAQTFDAFDAWDSLPFLLDEKAAAKSLGVSISFLRKSRSEGCRKSRTPAPPFVAIGGRRYYKKSDLKIWADSLRSQRSV